MKAHHMRNVYLAALLATSFPAVAQEVTSGAQNLKEDTNAIALQMDAKNQAVLAVLQTITTCNAKGKFYRPSAAGADASGCIGSDADRCGSIGRLYLPGQPGADSNGCKLPGDIPTGTIAAFLSSCPPGWTEYTAAAGRFLVGRGSNGANSYSTLGAASDDSRSGGRDEVRLKVANLPAHHHDLVSIGLRMVKSADGDKHGWFQGLKNESAYDASDRPDVRTANEGGGEPVENRPPFRVVSWCIKN